MRHTVCHLQYYRPITWMSGRQPGRKPFFTEKCDAKWSTKEIRKTSSWPALMAISEILYFKNSFRRVVGQTSTWSVNCIVVWYILTIRHQHFTDWSRSRCATLRRAYQKTKFWLQYAITLVWIYEESDDLVVPVIQRDWNYHSYAKSRPRHSNYHTF